MQKAWLTFLILFALILGKSASAQTPDEVQIYQEAKQAYYKQDYQAAEGLFLQLLQSHPQNGPLYYNLGNVYFQSANWGKARQFYEKALRVMPRNAELRGNLARLMSQLNLESKQNFEHSALRTFYFWQEWLTWAELQILCCALSVLFCGVLFWHFKKNKHTSWRTVAGFFIYGYLLLGCVIKYRLDNPDRFAVVLSPAVEIRANYLDQSQPLFTLPQGLRVEVIDVQTFSEQDKWLRIALPSGQTGWALESEFGRI